MKSETFSMGQLPEAVEKQIRQHCEREYPNEACGAIIGDGDGLKTAWKVSFVYESTNVFSGAGEDDFDRRRRYLIAPEFQMKAEVSARAKGLQVIGYYHSHPDHPAHPSEFDRQHAWVGYAYLICAVAQGRSGDLNGFSLNEDQGKFLEVSIHRN